jgi:DNA-binding beta-propeller fold protein YncE
MIKTRTAIVLLLLLMAAPGRGAAQTLGMVADHATQSVTVFNADTDTVLGTVPILQGLIGDCAIAPDSRLGFVTDFLQTLWVIDLSASPPALAAGVNPIPISNQGEDLALTPDGRFLVVCDGGLVQPVSVVDVASRMEIDTLDLGISCNAVDVCEDGSVLISSQSDGKVHRLVLDEAGQLSDTGEAVSADSPINVVCAPGGRSGVAIEDQVRSFLVPGLAPVDAPNIPDNVGSGLAAAFTPAGGQVFVRSHGVLSGFSFDPETADLSPAPLFQMPLAPTLIFYGIDQIAMHPDGSKLYVSNPPVVSIFDPETRAPLGAIAGPAIVQPTGVCLAATRPPLVLPMDIKPGNPQNTLNPRSPGIVHVALLDAAGVDPGSVRFGPAGARAVSSKIVDLDRDGDLDLLLSFRTDEAGLACGAAAASLSGQTLAGQRITASDSIRTVGCPPGRN